MNYNILYYIIYRTSDSYLRNRRIACSDRVRTAIHCDLQKYSGHVTRSVQFNRINFSHTSDYNILVSKRYKCNQNINDVVKYVLKH